MCLLAPFPGPENGTVQQTVHPDRPPAWGHCTVQIHQILPAAWEATGGVRHRGLQWLQYTRVTAVRVYFIRLNDQFSWQPAEVRFLDDSELS